MDIKKITHLFYWLRAKRSGLLRTPRDDRDLDTGIFNWFGYTPKNTRKENKTISIKDQSPFNTCQWNASIVAKEPDENKELSVRRFVSWAKRKGYVSGDGFSNLRSGQIALKDYGAEELNPLNEVSYSWDEYSNSSVNLVEAEKHKSRSFWSVSSRSDVLKLIDDGRILTTGLDWFTGFNQGGGFDSPWIIEKKEGYLIGGHAVAIIGYDLNYKGKKVYIVQNSYGKDWGDNGKFYITMDYLDANNYGFWVNLDIEVDYGKFVNEYDGKNVKGKKSNTIYFIQKGVKKPYLHEMDYFVYNIADPLMKNFSIVDDTILDKVPKGDNMDIAKSLYWPALQHLEQPLNLTRVLEAIKDNSEILK